MKPMIYYRIKEYIFHIGAKWDKKAVKEENAIDFAHEHINAEPKQCMDSLEYLLANGGENINKQLRNRKMQDVDLYIRDIINMLNNNTTDTDLIVYRGIQDNVFNEVLKSLIEEASIFPDCDLYDKGILATSLVKGKELRGLRSPQKPNKFKGFRILVPKGSHVKYMGNVNFEEHYYEVDIQHGAKLQVISADKEYINCLLLSTN